MMTRVIVNIDSGLPLGGTTMRMIVNIYSGLPLGGTTEIQKDKTDNKASPTSLHPPFLSSARLLFPPLRRSTLSIHARICSWLSANPFHVRKGVSRLVHVPVFLICLGCLGRVYSPQCSITELPADSLRTTPYVSRKLLCSAFWRDGGWAWSETYCMLHGTDILQYLTKLIKFDAG